MSIINLILAFAAGMGIGTLYFSILWWTVRELPGMKNKALWMIGSFCVRMVVTLTLFYLLMVDSPLKLIIALTGFMGMRIVFSRWLGPAKGTGEA